MTTRKQTTFDSRLPGRPAWWTKPIYWVAVILSGVWLYLAADYFVYAGWWENRFHLSPAEFVGMISSQVLPFVLIWFVVAWVERRNQLRQETDMLRSYMSQLMYPTEEGAVYTKTLTDALRRQIMEFKNVFAAMATQTNETREDLKQWVKDLALVMEQADVKTVATAKELAKHVSSLAKSTEKANDATLQITDSLQDRARILQGTSEKIAHIMGGISGVLTENVARIETVTGSLVQATDKTETMMDKAGRVCDAFDAHSARLDSVFERYEAQTQEYNNRLFENAEKILTVLKTQGAFLDQEVEKSVHKLSAAQEKVAEQSQALFQLSDQALHHLNDVGSQFVLQTEVMSQALKETETKVQNLTQLGIHEEAEKLIETSKKAESYFKQLKADLQDVQTDQFMKDARLILEHLATFSMDIVHIFTPKAEEELWKKYYAGDNSAFMRYLITALPDKKTEKVKELFEQNPACRVAMMRYMGEFDALAAKAKESEKKSVLLPVLIGSDAGRLYMILKHIVGPKKKGGV